MSQIKIIVEIQGGRLHSLHSNTDLILFLIDRDNFQTGSPKIEGPFSPTLISEDLKRAFPDDPDIYPVLNARKPLTPFF